MIFFLYFVASIIILKKVFNLDNIYCTCKWQPTTEFQSANKSTAKQITNLIFIVFSWILKVYLFVPFIGTWLEIKFTKIIVHFDVKLALVFYKSSLLPTAIVPEMSFLILWALELSSVVSIKAKSKCIKNGWLKGLLNDFSE